MSSKSYRVIDNFGFYRANVQVKTAQDKEEKLTERIIGHVLKENESLLDAPIPDFKPTGFARPRWDGNAWVEGATPEEIAAADTRTLDEVRTKKLIEISTACNMAITAGCDVTLADGSTGHFSLMETDQINLTAAVAAVEQGAASYPYHADGELCKLFPAADIVAVAQAATTHKLYHTTYCNHLLVWVRRAETVAELDGITYGAALPDDLAANMQEVLAGAQKL